MQSLCQEIEKLKLLAKKQRQGELTQLAHELKQKIEHHNHCAYVCAKLPLQNEEIASFSNEFCGICPTVSLLIATEGEGKCHLMLKLADTCLEKGLTAHEIIKNLAPHISGSGGGKQTTAQAGGTNSAGIETAFKAFKKLLEDVC